MAKVTSKGQITIPVSIRKRLSINEGDKLLFIDRPDGVMMVNPNMFKSGQGDGVSAAPPFPEDSAYAPFTSMTEAPHESDPCPAPAGSEERAPRAKEYDVSALLNEIRSIGSIRKE